MSALLLRCAVDLILSILLLLLLLSHRQTQHDRQNDSHQLNTRARARTNIADDIVSCIKRKITIAIAHNNRQAVGVCADAYRNRWNCSIPITLNQMRQCSPNARHAVIMEKTF